MIGRQLFERLLIWDLFLACSMLWLYAGHVRMQKKHSRSHVWLGKYVMSHELQSNHR